MSHPDLTIVLLGIGAIVGYMLRGHLAKERFDNISSQLAGEVRRVEVLEKTVGELKGELEAAKAAALKAPTFGPDDVIQRGEQVGEVVGLSIQLHSGTLTAMALHANGRFNRMQPFELRGYRVLLTSAASEVEELHGGRMVSQSYTDIICRVLPD